MAEYNPMLARKVVTDIGRAQNAIDGALRKFSSLTTGVLEALADAQVSDVATQPALEDLAEGFQTIVAGRRAFVNAHLKLIDMKIESNLRTVEIGCSPGPVCPWIEPEANLQLVA